MDETAQLETRAVDKAKAWDHRRINRTRREQEGNSPVQVLQGSSARGEALSLNDVGEAIRSEPKQSKRRRFMSRFRKVTPIKSVAATDSTSEVTISNAISAR